jgi:hypothetical protein
MVNFRRKTFSEQQQQQLGYYWMKKEGGMDELMDVTFNSKCPI